MKSSRLSMLECEFSVCLQEREGEPRVDLSGRPGLHVGSAEHLQPDPPRTEGPGGPRLPPVQREGAALAQPRGAAAGIPLLHCSSSNDDDGGISRKSQMFLLSEPSGLRLSLRHLQPGNHSLRAGKRTRALQGHARHTGEDPAGRLCWEVAAVKSLPPHLQMLLEKLNGTVPCLLDTTTIPPEELALKPSRSGADSGICEGPGVGGVRHSNGEPSSSAHPYNRTFSPHFHAFVELCLQRDPEKRLFSLSSQSKRLNTTSALW